MVFWGGPDSPPPKLHFRFAINVSFKRGWWHFKTPRARKNARPTWKALSSWETLPAAAGLTSTARHFTTTCHGHRVRKVNIPLPFLSFEDLGPEPPNAARPLTLLNLGPTIHPSEPSIPPATSNRRSIFSLSVEILSPPCGRSHMNGPQGSGTHHPSHQEMDGNGFTEMWVSPE